jgi:type I phosphodiesterase/nucleotide pyrophosphatase
MRWDPAVEHASSAPTVDDGVVSDARAEPVRPAYDGAWVGGIVPALLRDGGADWLPPAVRGARAVVLLVLDGLGAETLERHPELLPTTSGLEGRRITTVVPSTTSAALTSIACGATPAEHGIVGYRMRVGGRSLNVLRWQSTADEAVPDPVEVQPLEPFLGKRVPIVTRAEFRSTGFTTAHLRGMDFVGWRTISALLELVPETVEQGAPFVYAYYDGVDKVAHEFGLTSAIFATELMLTDRVVADLLDRLPHDVALLVTADHGQVQVGPAGAVPLDDVRRLVTAYSGEGRFRSLHARAGAGRDLEDACTGLYSDRAWVLTRERLFDEGWMGEGAQLAVRGRVGDVVLAAREPVIFVDPGQTKETQMLSQHGSLTAAEMEVPLLADRGRRR